MTAARPLRICLALSNYRGDAAVAATLGEVAALPVRPFERVFVVDSLGSGAIPALIAKNGWGDWVDYFDSPENLGSAGNLARRLKLAAEQGFDFVYAMNHDGRLSPEALEKLLAFARLHPDAGAVYPLRRYPNRHGRFESARRRPFRVISPGALTPPTEPVVEVSWSSSNCALYGLAPVRLGLAPYADFWMGWEDLAYGWLLAIHGYKQYVVSDAVIDDDYEFKHFELGPIAFAVVDKPAWYSYYGARNLLLAVRLVRPSNTVAAVVAARLLAEAGVTLALRDHKRERLRLYWQGLKDGLKGVGGKGPVP